MLIPAGTWREARINFVLAKEYQSGIMYAVERDEFLLGQPGRMKEAFEVVVCSGWHQKCSERNVIIGASPGTALCVWVKAPDSGMRNGS